MYTNVVKNIQKQFFIFLLLFFTSICAYALPFNIEPKAGVPFPTTVQPGSTVTAYYTVRNNTVQQRNNNFVKTLPQNVTQVTSGGTYGDTCGTKFDLTQKGLANDSCTLQLTISGAVKSSDTKKLLVCFPGGTTCAGTPTPLNVTQTPAVTLTSIIVTPFLTSLNKTATLQYTALGIYSDCTTRDLTDSTSPSITWISSNTAAATISSVGVATGVGVGNTNITAVVSGVTSNIATLSVANPVISFAITPATSNLIAGRTQQYTAIETFFDQSTVDVTSSVTWHSSNPAAATINDIAHPGQATAIDIGSTNISATLGSLTSNSAVLNDVSYLYSIDTGNGLSVSSLDINGAPSLPTDVTVAGIDNEPVSIVTNSERTIAYLCDGVIGVYRCPINSDGTLGTCQFGAFVQRVRSAAINQAGTFYYAVSRTDSLAYVCPINEDGSFQICQTTGSFTSPTKISINPAGTFAYIAKDTLPVMVYSPINPTTGALGASSAVSLSNATTPTNVTFDQTSGLAYFNNNGLTQISYCPYNSDGTFGTCNLTGNVDSLTSSEFVINVSHTFAYIGPRISPPLTYCAINPNGTLTNCISIFDQNLNNGAIV